MATSLLVLGGTGFVGRAAVLEAVARGWDVTTFNRGRGDAASDSARLVVGDRLDPGTVTPLAEHDWDLVLDTWSGPPRAARDSAALLAPRARRYVYISSVSVYAPPPPIGVEESAPTVDASPGAEGGDYRQCKRGAELAILDAFGERALLARAGLILGPYEDVGRLRAFNVVSRRGHATMGSLLEACRSAAGAADARLTWLAPETIVTAGIEPWTELPIWLPPEHEFAGLHAANVERAYAAGLRCRPVEQTVRDTWTWLSELGGPAQLRAGLDPPGLDPARERVALDSRVFTRTPHG